MGTKRGKEAALRTHVDIHELYDACTQRSSIPLECHTEHEYPPNSAPSRVASMMCKLTRSTLEPVSCSGTATNVRTAACNSADDPLPAARAAAARVRPAAKGKLRAGVEPRASAQRVPNEANAMLRLHVKGNLPLSRQGRREAWPEGDPSAGLALSDLVKNPGCSGRSEALTHLRSSTIGPSYRPHSHE